MKFERDWAKPRPKVWFLKNLRQNILNKVEKSRETGQDKKSFISAFASFLTAIIEV